MLLLKYADIGTAVALQNRSQSSPSPQHTAVVGIVVPDCLESRGKRGMEVKDPRDLTEGTHGMWYT